MRTTSVLLALGLLLGSAPSAPASGSQEDVVPEVPVRATRGLRVGAKLPPETPLRTLDGRQVVFRDLRGLTVLFVFWSSRCPYARFAEPKLVQLAKDYAKKGVLVVAVNSNVTEIGTKQVNGNGLQRKAIEASYRATYPELVEHYLERKLNFPVVIDTKNRLADALGAKVTPEAFLFDGKGRLRYAGAIDDDPKNEKLEKRRPLLREALDELLASREPRQQRTTAVGCTIKRAGTGVAVPPQR